MTDKQISLAAAEAMVSAALQRCRTSDGNAAIVARALVAAEADGLKGHGLSRVASYAAQAKIGKIDGFAEPSATQSRPATLLVRRRAWLRVSGARSRPLPLFPR